MAVFTPKLYFEFLNFFKKVDFPTFVDSQKFLRRSLVLCQDAIRLVAIGQIVVQNEFNLKYAEWYIERKNDTTD